MSKQISKRRQEMGEEAWAAYQSLRQKMKQSRYFKANTLKVILSRQNKKRALVTYKGGKCQRCDFQTDILEVYDFHHRDPSEKEFDMSHGGKNISLERCKIEVDKCDLLCKNCHAIVHRELYLKRHGL
jgi:hypothetical protein